MKGSAVVRDESVRDPERVGGETAVERALRLERASNKPFAPKVTSTAAVAPPPSPPRPSTSAPSPAPVAGATLNIGAVRRPPASTVHWTKAPPPPPDADGTVWVSNDRAAEILGLASNTLPTLMREHSEVRRRKHAGKESVERAPFYYAEADVQAFAERRKTSPYVHANRGKARIVVPPRPGDLPPSGVRIPRYFEAPVGVKADAPPEPLDDRVDAYRPPHVAAGSDLMRNILAVDVSDEALALLERMLATGLYGRGPAAALAGRLLLAELRRHFDMPRLIERARR